MLPQEESEGFKRNMHNLIRAFISFILSTGIQLRKDKTSDSLNMLLSEFEQFKKAIRDLM